jgi:hypothetical protein
LLQDKEMTSNINEIVLEDIKPLLQLKRPLLPIDKYAVREGITRRMVEEYARLGIVQIRKYKGKTYVVDVPLSPYLPESEGLQVLQENFKMETPTSEKQNQQINKTNRIKMISDLIPPSSPRRTQKTIGDTHRIADKPKKPNIEPIKANSNPGLSKGLLDQASKISNKLAGKSRYEFNNKPVSTSAAISQDNRHQFDVSTKQAGVGHTLKIGAFSLIGCLFIAFLAYLWLYMNQKVHSGRLDQATANIKNVYDDFVQTNQQLATFQGKLLESTAEIEWLKNELKNSRAESESMRNELTQIKRSLDAIQQYDTAALGQLREQLQQLTAKLGKVIKNPETLSDSNSKGN